MSCFEPLRAGAARLAASTGAADRLSTRQSPQRWLNICDCATHLCRRQSKPEVPGAGPEYVTRGRAAVEQALSAALNAPSFGSPDD